MTHLIKPILGTEYPEISHGKGVYLYDTNGKKYLDGSSGAMTAAIGHGVEEMADAMHEQAKKISYVFRGQFTSEPAEKLAETLAREAPGDLDWAFFVNSGSEATEIALKIAVQYWQERGRPEKNRILSRWMSYHGVTLGALSMSGNVIRRQRFEALLNDFPGALPPYCYRCPFNQTYPSCGLACANDIETAIQKVGAENIAAFIFEPIIGASGGAIVPQADYYKRVKEICDKYEILTIADEVVTGLGRTGKMFAMDHWDVQPDLMTLGKGLGGGCAPIGAAMVSDRVIDTIKNGSKMMMAGHTLSANPQSTATGLAAMNYLKKHHLPENAAYQGEVLRKGLEELEKKYPMIGNVRGKGLLRGIEFVADKETKQPFDLRSEVTNRVIKKGYEKGLILYNAAGGLNGTGGDAILLTPPLVINTVEVQELLTLLDEVIHEISVELYNEGLLTWRSIS
ncbi:MAG TPA: aspartate aminotransferase family protein [Bacillales bacterium]|nr:aspartate aminotransferase family protein [Bacillales bacterium]